MAGPLPGLRWQLADLADRKKKAQEMGARPEIQLFF